jgi:outer membrane protein assembly factor BamA
MRPGGQARVERIWFEGNTITRESVLRQLLAIEEGDVLRESAVDQSVQALRRSDLFKSASVRVIRGSRPTTRYLLFTVEESQQIAIDLLGQTLTFRNVDLGDWPEDWEDLAQGVSLRGGGQRVRFFAQDDWQGVEFLDAFVSRYLLTRAALFRQTDDVDGAEEVWYTAEAGFGLQAFESRASLVPLFQLEYTSLDDRAAFASLPVMTGDVWTTALGLEGRLDLNLRDAERVPYLGFDVRGRALFGLQALGGDLGWRSVDAGARAHLPLGTNRRDQHYVLRVASSFAHVDPDHSGELLAHQRAFPDIRGFDTRSIGVPVDVGAETIVLGGTTAATASAEIRLPIPVGRRNAFAPFLDAATVSGDDDPFLSNPHAAAGATLYFSVFSERLEGFLYGAYPFLGDVGEKQYVGGGLGGSF